MNYLKKLYRLILKKKSRRSKEKYSSKNPILMQEKESTPIDNSVQSSLKNELVHYCEVKMVRDA